MRRILTAAAAIAALALSACAASTPQPEPPHPDPVPPQAQVLHVAPLQYHYRELANGLKVYAMPDPNTANVAAP